MCAPAANRRRDRLSLLPQFKVLIPLPSELHGPGLLNTLFAKKGSCSRWKLALFPPETRHPAPAEKSEKVLLKQGRALSCRGAGEGSSPGPSCCPNWCPKPCHGSSRWLLYRKCPAFPHRFCLQDRAGGGYVFQRTPVEGMSQVILLSLVTLFCSV